MSTVRQGLRNKLRILAAAVAGAMVTHQVQFKNVYEFECRDSNGNLKWTERVENLVVNQGLDDLLDKYFKGSAYTASHFVGLKSSGAVASGDTMSSHTGWAENTSYSNATRPALTLGTVSGQSVDNSASKATFNVNATTTINGAFVTTNNTKGGTTGVLYGAADFAVSRTLANGDVLFVTITLTATSA